MLKCLMRLYIIRHGDPNYELDDLTEAGHREAKALGKFFAREGAGRDLQLSPRPRETHGELQRRGLGLEGRHRRLGSGDARAGRSEARHRDLGLRSQHLRFHGRAGARARPRGRCLEKPISPRSSEARRNSRASGKGLRRLPRPAGLPPREERVSHRLSQREARSAFFATTAPASP